MHGKLSNINCFKSVSYFSADILADMGLKSILRPYRNDPAPVTRQPDVLRCQVHVGVLVGTSLKLDSTCDCETTQGTRLKLRESLSSR